MGFRPAMIPAPIVVQPHQQQDSVDPTPKRPTPLVGDWCDVPCPWTDSKNNADAPPQHTKQHQRTYAEAAQSSHHHHEVLALPQYGEQFDGTTPQSSDSQREDEKSTVTMGTTPSASWHATENNTSFVSNNRPVHHDQSPQRMQQKRSRQHKRHSPQQEVTTRNVQQQQQQQPQPVLVSRFLPPPPPGVVVCTTLLHNGSAFERYYAIVMRWYAAVLVALQFHREVPSCPRAEDYIYDFDGWVVEISQWWERNIGSRAPQHQRRR